MVRYSYSRFQVWQALSNKVTLAITEAVKLRWRKRTTTGFLPFLAKFLLSHLFHCSTSSTLHCY